MRRKSTRNTRNSSPEKKPESQRKSRRQSSRRRKRSSSRSSEESDELQSNAKDSVQIDTPDSAISTDIKPESDLTNSENPKQDETIMDSQIIENSPSVEQSASKSNIEVDKDSQERTEVEDLEEKKNKGKSKGKNNSNIEQSSNNIEPETENENVQGTHQSPSNDNADNENVVQNVNDSAKCNTEAQEGSKSETEIEDQQQKTLDKDFVSEYAQANDSSQDNENATVRESQIEKNDNINRSERISTESRSDTNQNMTESNTDVSMKNKSDSTESPSLRRKITLKRSPPENRGTSESPASKAGRSSSTEEKKTEEAKSIKKITLKRYTTDDSSVAETENKSSISRSLSEEIVERTRRRLSSLVDDKEQEGEVKPKKVPKPIKLIRNLSCEDVGEAEKLKRVALRRKKWCRSDWLNKLTSSLCKVDVDSIKIVCPGMKFLTEDEVDLELKPKERKYSETEYKRKVSIDAKSEEDSDRPEYEKQVSEESAGEQKVDIIAMNRKISIVDDTASKLRPPPSPAKNPTSDVLFIMNLVRPFTVKQLKELLERTGKIKEDKFWTDRIKSKCYVQYESVEEAEATRNALHGIHWPIGNGKKLVIDYATEEDLQKAKNPAPPPAADPEKVPEKENREPERDGKLKEKDKDREERRKRDVPVREWDLGKESSRKRYSRSTSRSRDRTRKHSRRSYTPDEYVNSSKRQRKAEDSVPQKLMDDLFLKTKATPSIYWQPLSPEEIARKQQQRLVRMEEHKRKIEETRVRPRDNRRNPFRRR